MGKSLENRPYPKWIIEWLIKLFWKRLNLTSFNAESKISSAPWFSIATICYFLLFSIGISFQIKNFADEDAKSPAQSLFTNHLEFPVINEMYRGRNYCVLYGWTAIQLSRQVGDDL